MDGEAPGSGQIEHNLEYFMAIKLAKVYHMRVGSRVKDKTHELISGTTQD